MEKKFFCKDRQLSVILMLISVYFAYEASKLQPSNLQKDPGPSIFPWIGCGIMMLCAIYLFIRPGADGRKLNLNKDEKKRLLVMIGLYISIVIGTVLIGITYTLPVVLYVISYLFSKSSKPDMPTRKRAVTTLIYTVVVSVALYLTYVVALGVNLKSGILF